MPSDLAALEARLKEHADLESAAALLRWDQATYLPAAAPAARGRQLAHHRLTDPEIGRLLDRLGAQRHSSPLRSSSSAPRTRR